MLTDLSVRDLAIIERVEVGFGPRLNVVTGETGSGKSILIKALQLVLGGRCGADVVRHGASQAEVEALFRLPDPVRRRLAEMQLPDDEELVIRRTISGRGQASRAMVNGHLTTMSQLRSLARGLVDISSQHEHHTLVDPSTHLQYLDAFGDTHALLEVTSASFFAAEQARQAVEELAREAAHEQVDLWRWQLAELERLDPKQGEVDAIEEELGRLEHAELLIQATSRAAEALRAREPSLVRELGRHEGELARAAALDGRLAPWVERMASARAELEDLAQELARYARAVEGDPERVASLRERRREILAMCRKHATDEAGLVQRRVGLAARLERVDHAEHHLERLEKAAREALAVAMGHARELSATRQAVAGRLGEAVTRELADLGMGAARVQVDVRRAEPGPKSLAIGEVRLGESGIDAVELLIAPNPGEPPRSLSRVASGGELSRSLLAIKRVLAGLGPVGLYVFDEVDTGVGGAVADAIARKLTEVSRHHQVLCITHLAPIAAWGDAHYVVAKRVERDRTTSHVALLTPSARVDELARMLGGRRITETTRQAARELISLATERPTEAPCGPPTLRLAEVA